MTTKALLSDSASFFFSKLLPGLVYFILTGLIASKINSENYANFSMMFFIMISASSITVGWFNQYQLRQSGKIFNLQPLANTLLLPIGLAAGLFFLSPKASITIISITIYSLYLLRLISLQASLQTKKYREYEFLRGATLIAIGLIIWNSEIKSGEMIFLLLITSFIIPWLFSKKKPEPIDSITICKTEIKKAFTFGWPIGAWLAIMSAIQIFERWLIGSELSTNMQGIYSASHDLITRGSALFIMPITMAVHSRYMSAKNKGTAISTQNFIKKAMLVFLLFATTILISWLLKAERILYFIFPKLPEIGGGIFWMMVLSSTLWQFSLIMHKPLEGSNKTKSMLLFLCISIAILASWELLLINTGIHTIPLAGILSACTYMSLCYFYIKHREK